VGVVSQYARDPQLVIGKPVIETNFRMIFRNKEARLATRRPYTGSEVSAGN
jgi:N-dimethylarginine dimethylaminohydrolase